MSIRKNRKQINKEVNSKWRAKEKVVRKAARKVRAAAKVNDLAYKLQTK